MRALYVPSIPEHSMRFKQWLAEKHDHDVSFFPEESYGYGIINDDGDILLACVLQGFHFPGDILSSYFAEDPKIFFSKRLVKEFIHLPFQEPWNARRITILLNTKHHRSVEVAIKYGFRGEGILKDHFPGEDATILSLLRSQVMEA